MPQAAGFVVGALGLTAGSAAAAVGTFAYGAALGAGAGLLTTVAIRLATSVALSALSAALAPKPKKPTIPGMRSDATLAGGINPESFIFGRAATAGVLAAPWMSHGKVGKTPNAFLTYVVELHGVPGAELVGLQLNGEAVPIEEDDPHEDYGKRIGGRFAGKAWIKYYDGTQTAADPMLLAKYPAPLVRPWSSDMIGQGICYAILTFQYDREVFTSFPQVQFVLQGLRLYDPRRDSTAGGSGSQRWADPATWAFSENPAVMIYNILRGIRLPGGEVWGGGIPAEDIPYATWAAAMDACDEPVSDGAGGTEPAYRAGREVFVDDEPFSVIEVLLDCCNGKLAERGGVWTIRVGAPALPVMAFTDADLLADAADAYAPFPRLSEIYNAITATWTSPADAWQPREADPLTNPGWEAEDDDRRLTASVELGAVTSGTQVQRLMAAMIADHRRMRVHQIVLPPAAIALDVLDTVAWTSESNGYTAKLFEAVRGERELQTGRVAVTLREIDPDDFDPVAVMPVVPVDSTPVLPAVQAVPGWAVAPWTIMDGDSNARRPALRATWDADAADDATALRIAARLASAGGDGSEVALVDPRAGEYVWPDVVPGESYALRARFAVDRPTEWSAWETATAPDVRLGLADLQADVAGWLDDLGEWIDGGVTDLPQVLSDQAQAISDETLARIDGARDNAARWREVGSSIRALVAEAADLAARDHAARDELRASLAVQLGALRASYEQLVVVTADEAEATALRLTTLEAATDGLSSTVTQVDQARVEGDEALGQLIATISVGSAVQFDHTAIWYFDEAVEDWTGSPDDPSVTAQGWLRPGADSTADSPAGLGLEVGTYPQVRARLRKIGSPVWQGWLWWAGAGEGWDAARRVTISEPGWDGGIGLITVTPGWTGEVDRIRFELTDNADGSNYLEFDWIALGRPAPGASSAELASERSARIDGDQAIAQDVTDLDVRLEANEGLASGTAGALGVLTGRVDSAEGTISSQGLALTALEGAVEDPETGLEALGEALDQLTVAVTDGDGSQLVQSEAIRDLRSALRAAIGEVVDGLARTASEGDHVRDLLAAASQLLASRIDLTDDQLRITADAVTRLAAEMGGLASASALQALQVLVGSQGGTLTSQGSAITDLENTINDPESGLGTKLAASAIGGYYTKLETDGVAASAAASATSSLKSEMEGTGGSVKAAQDAAQSAYDLANGKGRVFVQGAAPTGDDRDAKNLWIDTSGGANTPKRWSGSAWVAVTDKVATDAAAAAQSALNALPGKADASVVSSLSTTVGGHGDTLSAVADGLTQLGVTLDGASAETRLRMTAEATPDGASARIGLKATATGAEGDSRTAALFLDAMPGDTSRVVVVADEFAVSGGGALAAPFIVSGGQVWIDNAFIHDLTADRIVAGGITRSGQAGSAPTTYETGSTWKTVCGFTLEDVPLASSVLGVLQVSFTKQASGLGGSTEIQVLINSELVHTANTSSFSGHDSRLWLFNFGIAQPAGDIEVLLQMRNFPSGEGIARSLVRATAYMR